MPNRSLRAGAGACRSRADLLRVPPATQKIGNAIAEDMSRRRPVYFRQRRVVHNVSHRTTRRTSRLPSRKASRRRREEYRENAVSRTEGGTSRRTTRDHRDDHRDDIVTTIVTITGTNITAEIIRHDRIKFCRKTDHRVVAAIVNFKDAEAVTKGVAQKFDTAPRFGSLN